MDNKNSVPTSGLKSLPHHPHPDCVRHSLHVVIDSQLVHTPKK